MDASSPGRPSLPGHASGQGITNALSNRQQALQNITVVVTRSLEQNAVLREELETRGAEVVSLPTLRFQAVSLNPDLQRCLAAPETYTHLLFTSRVAVAF